MLSKAVVPVGHFLLSISGLLCQCSVTFSGYGQSDRQSIRSRDYDRGIGNHPPTNVATAIGKRILLE